MAEWYYAEGGEQLGPVSGEDLKQRIQSGQIPQSTLVWEQSMKDWTPASRVPYLMDQQVAAPPLAEGVAAHGAVPAGYAGFWKRFAAFIIDRIILLVGGGIVGGVFGFIYGLSNPDPNLGMVQLYASFIGSFINFLYFTLFESSPLQATPGKMALGIVVTDLDGNRISYLRALGRYFAKILSLLTFFIGYIMAGLTARKQALHDLIAGCLVVNKG